MPTLHLSARGGAPEPIRAGLARLREELDVPEAFPAEVLAEAERAASEVSLPGKDRTDLPLVTIDPPGSTDLDQAVHIERDGDGYVVWYAIADVGAFVTPGGAIDAEAHERGVTLYAPDGRTPLHPPVLSEGAASLLPGQNRPSLLWEHRLDSAGEAVRTTVVRARVRSREQLTYEGVQAALDSGTASPGLQLLREVGLKREAIEAARGGVSLQIPEQEVHVNGDGGWELVFRATLPVEGWNAQISLLTGLAAAKLMLDARIGIVRTLPPATQYGTDRLRRIAKGLKIRWPGAVAYPDFVRSLDPTDPRHLAMLDAATTLFRGAGYAAFDGDLPEQPLHGAMNAAYAHCTAPLRRLVDRFVGETCLALCAGEPVPDWVRAELPTLPETMAQANRRAGSYERGILDLVEALLLAPHVGETFQGTIVSWNDKGERGEVQLAAPAVTAPVTGRRAAPGDEVTAALVAADVLTGKVAFEL